MTAKPVITVSNRLNMPVEAVWKYWTEAEHVVRWNHASDDWHTTRAENDLRKGGQFLYRMEAKDGSFGFDFYGEYMKVVKYATIESKLGDGREVSVSFTGQGDATDLVESFEAEGQNSLELQRSGWQAILDNFKRYAEDSYREILF